jgi:hypothetical protein
MVDDVATVFSYTFRYAMESSRALTFTQADEHGETIWRFVR